MRENYVGQIFGNRKIIRNYCEACDWENIGKEIPKSDIGKYRLTECLNCGTKIPSLIPGLKKNPPKRCSFCSNINHISNINSFTNNYVEYDDYCILNISFKNEILTTFFDKEDYSKIKKYHWRISKKKNKFYVIGNINKKSVYLHSFILHQEIPENFEIDHIDGNSLNNRKENLRIISRIENIQNSKARIDNQIGIRGISYNKQGKNFVVDFSYNKKRFYFKRWNTLEEAVYCRFITEEYFGLEILKRNPLFEQYNTLSEEKKQAIKKHVYTVLNTEKSAV